MKVKHAILLCALLAASAARADTIQNFSGVIHEPGETITYNLTVDTSLQPTFVFDVLNGQIIFRDPALKCKPCTTTITNDGYIFGFNETMLLATFGLDPVWNLIGTPTGAFLVDPPSPRSVATPEPQTVMLIAAGICLLFIFAPRRVRR